MLELKGFSYFDFLAAEEVIESSRVCEAPPTACRSSFRLKAIAAGWLGPVYGLAPVSFFPPLDAGLFQRMAIMASSDW